MRDGITEHAEANWRINIAPDLTPFFEVGDGVALGGLHSLCLGDIENTPLAAERECTRIWGAHASRVLAKPSRIRKLILKILRSSSTIA